MLDFSRCNMVKTAEFVITVPSALCSEAPLYNTHSQHAEYCNYGSIEVPITRLLAIGRVLPSLLKR